MMDIIEKKLLEQLVGIDELLVDTFLSGIRLPEVSFDLINIIVDEFWNPIWLVTCEQVMNLIKSQLE